MIRTIFFLTHQSDTGKLNLVKADQEVLIEVNGDSEGSKFDGFVKSHFFHFSVIPAEAGIQ